MNIAIIVLVTVAIVGGILYILTRPSTPRPEEKSEFSEEEYNRHYESKQGALERVLGPMHDIVGHAIIPFRIGGAVDMYYFPGGVPGTGFATMELIEPDGSGPKPNRIGTYELVAFTKQPLPTEEPEDEQHPFKKIERRFCGIFTAMGRYSRQAVLNPGETCEIPGNEDEPNKCMIFDEYAPEGKAFEIEGKNHCLLLCLEVFRSELEHARANGSAVVLKKLKEAGHYPYSDLDRAPVF